jgi:outer membrane protein assembly factor BamB
MVALEAAMRSNRRRTLVHMAALVGTVVGAVVALALPAGPSWAAGGLSMTGFSPMSGAVGKQVTITGKGFVPADIVQFDGVTAVVKSVNAKGTKLVTTVPPLASTGPLTVGDPTTGQVVGLPGTVFTVLPGMSVDPGAAWPGSTITVTGSGLSPDTDEPLYLKGVLVATPRTSIHGTFTIGVEITEGFTPGQLRILLVDPFYGQIVSIVTILASWSQFHYDTTRVGTTTYETILKPATVSGLKQHWSQPVPVALFAFRSSVVVHEGLAYIGSADDNVYAFDATTGAPKWTFTTGAAVESSPAGLNGLVYVGSDDGHLYALNRLSGTVAWSFDTGSPVRSSPAAVGNAVYFGADNGNVYAVNATTGAQLWSTATGGAVWSSPAVVGTTVYVGSSDSYVYALKTSNGSQVWRYKTGDIVVSAPAVSQGTVYVGGADSYLYSLNAKTGAFNWRYQLGSFADWGSPAVTGGVVYDSEEGGGASVALNATTGTLIWASTVGGLASPAVVKGVMYVGDDFGHIQALDATNGNVLWTTTTPGGSIDSSPAISAGTLYIQSDDGHLYAFGL